jgi:hypothetical protein
MTLVNVRLDPDMVEALEEVASEYGVTRSMIIRAILGDAIDAAEYPMPKSPLEEGWVGRHYRRKSRVLLEPGACASEVKEFSTRLHVLRHVQLGPAEGAGPPPMQEEVRETLQGFLAENEENRNG